MPDERLEKTIEIFDIASELSGAAREDYLAAACGNDAKLQAEVEALLQEYDAAGAFLEQPILPELTTHPAELAGRRIGPYELLRELGSGGMGIVYLARRADDVYRKEVAVKLVWPHLQRTSAVRRFKQERQILARLDHPNIARLLDGGATEESGHYVVMEYVDGTPITEYCDERKLNITERLKLFRTVCAAVEYAHQNLVVHRELKPGNIFVTEEGVVKLLDFGIAKLLDPELKSVDMTHTGLHLLTPEYASPEQMRGETITTASDVYSLGVVLYELLTGYRPQRTKNLSLPELARAIAETEAERPSLALRRVVMETDAEGTARILHSPETVSALREGNSDKLRRRLQGDLDNIALKALRKLPIERYASVAQFSEDIQRHLTRQPVLAQPPTLAYRANRFVRRNKIGVAFAGFVVLTLIAAAVFAGRQWRADRAQARESYHGLYALRMNQAVQDRNDFNVEGIREAVESFLPQHQSQNGKEDMRGFEWYTLWRWYNRHLLTLPHNDPNGEDTAGAFTKDGTIVISGGNGNRNGIIKVWNAETGKLFSELPYGPNLSRSVLCWDETGVFVQKTDQQTLKIWQPSTDQDIASITHRSSPVTACNMRSNDPQGRLFTASEDGTIAAWGLNGKLLSTFKTGAPLTFLGVAPKRQRLIIVVDRKRLEFWDMTTLRLVSSVEERVPFEGGSVDETQDSLRLSQTQTGVVISYDWRTGRELRRFQPDPAFGNRVFVRGRRLFTFGRSKTVLVTDLLTGQRLGELQGHQELVRHGEVSPDDTLAATAGADRTVRLWDLQTYKQLAVIPAHDREVLTVHFSDDRRKLITGSQDRTVKIWDVASLLVPDKLEGHADQVLSVAFSPDSRKLATTGRDRTVKLWDAETGKLLHTMTGHQHDIFVVAFSPSGDRIATGSQDLTVRIWDTATGAQIRELNQFTRRPRAVTFSPDGKLLAIGCDYRDTIGTDDRMIRILETTTYRELAIFRGHKLDVVSLDFSPDGKMLASASWDGTIKLWDLTTGRELTTLRGHTDWVWSVRFSPDGRRLASGSTDRSVKLWDVGMGRELMTMKTHSDEVFSVAFSPDSKRLASGSNDKTIKLWDAATGRELVTFRDHTDQVFSVAFSPDGRMLASGSWDKTARIFRAATDAELRARIGK